MLEKSFPLSTERPEPGRCRRCGQPLEPIAVPVPGQPGQVRWLPKSRCDCEVAEWEQRQAELQVAAAAIGTAGATAERAGNGVGQRFADSRLSNFESCPGTDVALAEATAFVKDFAGRRERGEGLLFIGGYGAGKTRLASAILNEVQERHGASVRAEVVPELLQRLRQTYDAGSRGTEDQVLQPLLRASLLLLDDIGAERVTEWVQERLFLVIDHRYRHRQPTLFTTNLHPEDLEDRLGGRIVSRIIGMATLVRLSAEDYRLQEHPRQDA